MGSGCPLLLAFALLAFALLAFALLAFALLAFALLFRFVLALLALADLMFATAAAAIEATMRTRAQPTSTNAVFRVVGLARYGTALVGGTVCPVAARAGPGSLLVDGGVVTAGSAGGGCGGVDGAAGSEASASPPSAPRAAATIARSAVASSTRSSDSSLSARASRRSRLSGASLMARPMSARHCSSSPRRLWMTARAKYASSFGWVAMAWLTSSRA